MATKTKKLPQTKSLDIKNPKTNMLTMVDVTMLTAVANDLRMLSAYLMTAATTNPPPASKVITINTSGEYPWKNPSFKIAL
mmetsp:Transcript_25491/g.50900  ORF Transcript_25491/g.50900 Transcript_25491/m.50900 type:complete len:81 (-) Transcript_25491:858-1100(-)